MILKKYLALATLSLISAPALAQTTLRKGDDGLSTPGGGQTKIDLQSVPIEAIFGAPVEGSTVVSLKGKPFSRELPAVDTLIRRSQDATLLSASGKAALQVVGLSLESEEPVKIGGHSYQLSIHLSDFGQTVGQATFTQTNGDGGTFSASLPVVPRLTFADANGEAVVIDCGVVDCSSFELSISNVGWVRTDGPSKFDPQKRGVTVLPREARVDTDGDGEADLQLLGSSNFYPGFTATEGFPESPFGIATKPPIIVLIHWIRPSIPGPILTVSGK